MLRLIVVYLACGHRTTPPYCNGEHTHVLSHSEVGAVFTISDGSEFSLTYAPNTSCSWTVLASTNIYDAVDSIRLEFLRFQTELVFDTVTVFELSDANGTAGVNDMTTNRHKDQPSLGWKIIGQYSGEEIPGALVTRTGGFRVNFTSDSSINWKGFLAQYQATLSPGLPPLSLPPPLPMASPFVRNYAPANLEPVTDTTSQSDNTSTVEGSVDFNNGAAAIDALVGGAVGGMALTLLVVLLYYR